jgi:hypothetical protein
MSFRGRPEPHARPCRLHSRCSRPWSGTFPRKYRTGRQSTPFPTWPSSNLFDPARSRRRRLHAVGHRHRATRPCARLYARSLSTAFSNFRFLSVGEPETYLFSTETGSIVRRYEKGPALASPLSPHVDAGVDLLLLGLLLSCFFLCHRNLLQPRHRRIGDLFRADNRA